MNNGVGDQGDSSPLSGMNFQHRKFGFTLLFTFLFGIFSVRLREKAVPT